MEKTCELCGFIYNTKGQHQCDEDVLRNKAEEEKWRKDELNSLEADEMYLRDF